MNTKSAYFYIIATAIFLTLFTNFGNHGSLESFLFIKPSFGSIYSSLEHTYLINNEWWRLITPTFLHFSITHLAFNSLWIYILGSKIERMDGRALFVMVFFLTSVLSNAGQLLWSQQYMFGGLSGAVYGLLGYCFILELDKKRSRYNLPEALYLFMFIWLLVGFTGILNIFGFGNIANTAHLVGMIAGFIIGLIAKYSFKL
ncbi:MAG: peptidase, S54 family protein [SAR86 cluster bacterium BACL1 MAG-120924-bin88]|uniref:Peptidase, S54 family protein n=1 Tax=SAR86 cluster bacterium BACL1 MAG-120820-bin45 TaxID=1655612 RepID=A0A0R2U9S5_9GAMM|nr:MAG: peptidase, S54 family protein [SAR86 cluster bacterium BACL1 MAG-120507-bin14]KRO96249.1 MAG: peptidase, S54 family protein [SAR86 cluster bacterium BACL1 MAG-120820-bin45]KRO98157.1 MAG: peptidase, S54 family protein [SAR86 cluster bacterium BACL1 MAG-120823-bin87]KRP01971.1 MAG: peptidase, S54 family protein [SAR86 cluster bacterium BACL1 MAG-120924-bin88]KRP02089.1 MAG: peptidase, S54 family protein [SAR86 cluster bacterium BACL1 MAG-120619-bin26]KRP16442.1 MAG: peptidase, S54 famil